MTAETLGTIAATWPSAFIFGVLYGRHCERRHKETHMDVADRFRLWYDKWAPVLFALVGVCALIGIWVGTAATLTNSRQDAEAAARNSERDQQTAALLACFDEYAAAQSESSGAVRNASVRKDEATAVRDDALNREGVAFKRLVASLVAERVTAADFEYLLETLDDRADASRRLDRAQAALDRAREENPVPPPPSDFCDVKP